MSNSPPMPFVIEPHALALARRSGQKHDTVFFLRVDNCLGRWDLAGAPQRGSSRCRPAATRALPTVFQSPSNPLKQPPPCAGDGSRCVCVCHYST